VGGHVAKEVEGAKSRYLYVTIAVHIREGDLRVEGADAVVFIADKV
jgi:hypothetical protein